MKISFSAFFAVILFILAITYQAAAVPKKQTQQHDNNAGCNTKDCQKLCGSIGRYPVCNNGECGCN